MNSLFYEPKKIHKMCICVHQVAVTYRYSTVNINICALDKGATVCGQDASLFMVGVSGSEISLHIAAKANFMFCVIQTHNNT